ncbi:MAG: RsmB/NOP family class I SAM-dependent RNA methyltransferase [Trueperaceae bacterium]|nr:MAG: RsmB/NOP family class I SAM-dependent RNA methyltransferase [Trueperaceae bacterium]
MDATLRPLLRHPKRLPSTVLIALRVGSYELLIRKSPSYAVVHAWVELAKRESPSHARLVNAILRRVTMPRDLTTATRLSLPNWLFDTLQLTLGPDSAFRAGKAMLEPAPLWITQYREGAVESLKREGCEVSSGPFRDTFRLRPSKPLRELEAYRRGWIQPQNPSSTVPVRLLEPKPSERVLDLASGNGIKTAQLASRGAVVTAIDASQKKVRPAQQNLSRLGLSASHLTFDLTRVPKLPPAKKVLLDAPCTGTGTLRGHPEIKLRLDPADLKRAARLQKQLLTTAAALTQVGGTLVYAVCSLTLDEGEDQIRSFLRCHPTFEVHSFTLPIPTSRDRIGSYILPYEGRDGFYVAKLKRIA